MFCRSILHIRRRVSLRPTAHGSGTRLCDKQYLLGSLGHMSNRRLVRRVAMLYCIRGMCGCRTFSPQSSSRRRMVAFSREWDRAVDGSRPAQRRGMGPDATVESDHACPDRIGSTQSHALVVSAPLASGTTQNYPNRTDRSASQNSDRTCFRRLLRLVEFASTRSINP